MGQTGEWQREEGEHQIEISFKLGGQLTMGILASQPATAKRDNGRQGKKNGNSIRADIGAIDFGACKSAQCTAATLTRCSLLCLFQEHATRWQTREID